MDTALNIISNARPWLTVGKAEAFWPHLRCICRSGVGDLERVRFGELSLDLRQTPFRQTETDYLHVKHLEYSSQVKSTGTARCGDLRVAAGSGHHPRTPSAPHTRQQRRGGELLPSHLTRGPVATFAQPNRT